jgi:hypothetical protein
MDYNSLEGIKATLSSYDSFAQMIRARSRAYYERKEKLDQFIVLGSMNLDSCGNLWKLEKSVDTAGDVETTKEFYEKYKENGYSRLWSLPSRVCSRCKKSWDMSTKDFLKHHIVTDRSRQLVLNEYVGQTFASFNRLIKIDKEDCFCYLCFSEDEANFKIEKDKIYYCSVTECFHHECMEQRIKEEVSLIEQGAPYNGLKNLAGFEFCDLYIETELKLAGVTINHAEQTRSEVPYTIFGTLNALGTVFTFHRAWYYWVVHGNVPLKIAQELYADEEGKKNVRVMGDCGCPAPVNPIISTYHIDSLKGLKLFVEKLMTS